MTREELENTVASIEDALTRRRRVVRVVCEPDGTEVGEIYRGSAAPAAQPTASANEKTGTKGKKS